MLPMGKSVIFTGACVNEIVPSINRSFVYKVKEGGHVRILNLFIYIFSAPIKASLDLTVPLDKDQENGLYFEWTPYNCRESVGKIESYIIKSCITDKQGVSCHG